MVFDPPPLPPPSKPPSRLRAFWQARSWKGKTALILGAVFVFLFVIGLAVPTEPSDNDVASSTTPPNTEATTQAEGTVAPTPPPILVKRVIDGDTLDLDSCRPVTCRTHGAGRSLGLQDDSGLHRPGG